MTIFVITLTWNGVDYLKNLYPTLIKALKNAVGNNYSWLIRDNASEDDTEATAKSWDDVEYLKVDHNNDNYSQCNNYLVSKADELFGIDYDKDYILFLNNDITIEDEYSIRYMLDIASKEDVGIVGARLFYPGKFIQHAGVAFSPKHGNMPWHIFSKDKDSIYTNQNRYYQAVTGACLLMKASCFKNLANSKMDERFYWAFDDIAMCLDVYYNQNKKIVYCGKTNIIHHESISLQKNKVNIKYMKHNVELFKKLWQKTYKLDYYDYLNDSTYNLYK